MLDSDFIPSDEFLGSDLEVSFPSGTRNKIFDPTIFFEVQSKRVFNPGILSSNLLSHRGKITSDFSESLMMISGGDIPFLDVKMIENRAKTGIYGFVATKSAYYSKTENATSDEELEAPIEDQPLPTDASPTALSPGYIADFDPEEDEEDPADEGDNDDNESSDDDDDDDDVRRMRRRRRRST
ncbi:hypothetical protein Tco_0015078 [Tanacetum coccineum]